MKEKRYFIVLMKVNWDKSVWLGLESGQTVWSENVENATAFSTEEEVRRFAELEAMALFNQMETGIYKVISFTDKEAKEFGIIL
ncbi:hypothetical protein [Streptococcus suis]|uniref:hypothetical protein n=1 Tax=Streptococcus suis TaxID=1307 RepID=UPI000CF3A774